MRTMPAGEFKAKCLALMDEVKATGESIVITKRAKPVVWLTPPREEPEPAITADSLIRALSGMVTIVGDPDDLVGPMIPEDDSETTKPDWSIFPPE